MKLFVFSLFALAGTMLQADNIEDQKFDLWGVSTSAYQIEGAWNEEGKGQSNWDYFTHTRNMENGDVACDDYHHIDSTINYLKELGVTTYRFSIAWTRIQPDGTGTPNQLGLDYYQELIHKLNKAGIDPMVTLFHWDLPQALEEKGGWTNRETVYLYEQYAKILFKAFGTSVKYWITHNEPRVVSTRGYGSDGMAPGTNNTDLIPVVDHHLLLSHGLAVKAYREMGFKGEIGISLNLKPIYSLDGKKLELRIKEDTLKNRVYLNPIFLGSYPDSLHLPYMKEGDMALINQRIDFLGVNYYSRLVVSPSDFKPENTNSLGWEIYPQAFYDLLMDLKNSYSRLPPIIITENGYADEVDKADADDQARSDYISSHILAVKKAKRDGAPIRGYCVWSLYDNLEWSFGYKPRFGLIHINFNTLQRAPKPSFYTYQKIIESSKTH